MSEQPSSEIGCPICPTGDHQGDRYGTGEQPSEEERAIASLLSLIEKARIFHPIMDRLVVGNVSIPAIDLYRLREATDAQRMIARLLAETRDALARSEAQALGYMRERDEAMSDEAIANRTIARMQRESKALSDGYWEERRVIEAERDATLSRVAKLEAALREAVASLAGIEWDDEPPIDLVDLERRIDALLAETTTPTTGDAE